MARACTEGCAGPGRWLGNALLASWLGNALLASAPSAEPRLWLTAAADAVPSEPLLLGLLEPATLAITGCKENSSSRSFRVASVRWMAATARPWQGARTQLRVHLRRPHAIGSCSRGRHQSFRCLTQATGLVIGAHHSYPGTRSPSKRVVQRIQAMHAHTVSKEARMAQPAGMKPGHVSSLASSPHPPLADMTKKPLMQARGPQPGTHTPTHALLPCAPLPPPSQLARPLQWRMP
jgi:hypothetical protein